jgi:probable F420-dependent oxidoreductase
MRFWQALSFSETTQLVELAKTCEEVGFHGVFVSDHLYHPEKIESKYPYSEDGAPPFGPETEWPEPWAAISAMAAVTTTLRFNTSVYIAPLRHPLAVAKSVATASVLSGGRVALGAGLGWIREEYEQLGQDFKSRGKRLDEMIEVLRKVWTGDVVEHHGSYYDFDRLSMSPPPPAKIPIYIGGASAPALRRAARNDGWLGSGNDPSEVPALVEQFRELRKEAGTEGEPFDIVVALVTPPDVDTFKRLEDAGVTGIISYPLLYTLGPGSTLEQNRGALEQYAEAFIRPCA